MNRWIIDASVAVKWYHFDSMELRIENAQPVNTRYL